VFLYFHAVFSAEKHIQATGSNEISSSNAALSAHFFTAPAMARVEAGQNSSSGRARPAPPRSFREHGAGAPSVNPLEVKT